MSRTTATRGAPAPAPVSSAVAAVAGRRRPCSCSRRYWSLLRWRRASPGVEAGVLILRAAKSAKSAWFSAPDTKGSGSTTGESRLSLRSSKQGAEVPEFEDRSFFFSRKMWNGILKSVHPYAMAKVRTRRSLLVLMLLVNRLGRSGAFTSAVRHQWRPLTTVTSAVGPRPTDPADEGELSTMTVVQLKERLREAGLPVSGKKVRVGDFTPSPPPPPPPPPPRPPPPSLAATHHHHHSHHHHHPHTPTPPPPSSRRCWSSGCWRAPLRPPRPQRHPLRRYRRPQQQQPLPRLLSAPTRVGSTTAR